jgi:hypothetical protein
MGAAGNLFKQNCSASPATLSRMKGGLRVKGYVFLLSFLCLTPVCVAADAPQCTRITNTAPFPGGGGPQNFWIFQNQWIVNGNGTVFASSDKGATWREILPKPPNVTVPSRIVGSFDGALFAIPQTGNFIIESRNGVDWATVQTPIRPAEFAAVADLWVINGGGLNTVDLRMSRDAGHTWVQAPALDPLFQPQFDHSWQLIRTKSRILLVDFIDTAIEPNVPPGRGSLTRVRRLSQNADRWEDVTPCPCNISFGNGSDFEGVLVGYAQYETGGGNPAQLLVTMDAGNTWSFRPLPTGGGIGIVSGGAVVTYFGAIYTLVSTRVLYSSDAGLSWRSVGDGLPGYPPGTTVSAPVLFGVTADSLLFSKPGGADLYSCSIR